MKRLSEDRIPSVWGTLSALDRTDQQTVSGCDVAVGVQQEGRGGDRRLQGSRKRRMASAESRPRERVRSPSRTISFSRSMSWKDPARLSTITMWNELLPMSMAAMRTGPF